jgi:hypothetical protein
MFNETANAAIASPELAKVRAKAIADIETLEQWEIELLDQYYVAFLNAIEVVYEHSQSGVVEYLDQEIIRSQIAHFISMPGAKGYWKRYRAMYGGPFLTLVDEQFGADA